MTTHQRVFLLNLLIFLAAGCVKPQKSATTTPDNAATVPANNPQTDYRPPAKTDSVDIYAEHVRTSAFKTPEEEKANFILPPGFEATLFAAEPDITKPINMAFDEKGRLWVNQSSEYPIAAGPNGGNDRMTILEDTDGDGRADKIQDFAHDLNIPIGIMPVKGGAIGYSIPNIYRFIDSNNDGKYDKKEVMFGEFGHKDTHGMINNMIRGFDGWMHVSHGYANTSVIAGTDGDSIRMYSGNTFRFKMDGSRVEKTTDGRINPFGSAFDEMGYHYSADCHTLPIYQLIWGGDYTQWGKKDRSMGFAPTMMDYDLNSTALAGLVYYTDTHFPAEYQRSFYSGDVVTCRVSRSTMEFKGSTPKAIRKQDFLVSKDSWFRPVDLKVGPDGALYIADFYNRIIGHYEVPLNHPGRDRISGRIWKITYKGNKPNPVVDWSKATQPELLAAMGHEVLQTRMKATDELVDRFGKGAVPALDKLVRDKRTDPRQLIQGVWALYRLEALPAKVLVSAINHPDVRVKVHAFKVLANEKTLSDDMRMLTLQNLQHPNPHVQRAAAEVLGRHPDPKSYHPLLALVGRVPGYDTHLRYTVLLSLKNHLQQEPIMRQVASEQWQKQEADTLAMIVADLQSVPAGRFLLQYLKTYEPSKDRLLMYTQAVARNIPEAELPQVVGFVKSKAANDPEQQYQLAKAMNVGMEQRGSKPNPMIQEWNVEMATSFLKNLSDESRAWNAEMKARQQYAAEIAGKYKVASLEPELKRLLEFRGADEDSRAMAAEALMNIAPERNAAAVARTLASGEESTALRRRLAQALGQSKVPAVRTLLGQRMKGAPYEVQDMVAYLLANDPDGKSQLIRLIRQGDAPARILKTRSVEERFLAGITPQQRQQYDELTAGILPISEERQKLIEKRLADFEPKGKTPVMGKAVFTNNCSMCHQIAKKGGLIGPQLDGIGNWGRTSLTTKILDPNRNISENFRNYNLTLHNGKTLSGLYRRDEGQLLVFADPSGKEFSVSQQDIKDKTPSRYTLMPDHFHNTISKDDFDALLVFLLSTK